MKEVFFQSADSLGRERMEQAIEGLSGFGGFVEVGRSICSRPIRAATVGRGRRRILIVGAHHGSEHITANLLYAYVYGLLTRDEGVGEDAGFILDRFTLIILPMLNPDGVELSLHGVADGPLRKRQERMCCGEHSLWQANARGVDLNHNYGAGFAEYKEIERREGIFPGATKYSGEYPESEPESRCAAGLVRATGPEAVVSLHAQGEEVFYSPRSGEGAARCGRIAERLAACMGYRVSLPEGSAAYGGLCDYTGSLGIPSFTLECGRGRNPLPIGDLSHIYPRVARGLTLLPRLL